MASADRRRAPWLPVLAAVVLAAATGTWLVANADVVVTPKGLRVDGRPLLPIGIYWAPTSKFAQLRDMGFNVVHLWASSQEVTRRELDEAHRLGMRAVIELSELARANKQLPTTLQPFVDAVRAHPALLAWYLVDEPGPNARARIQEGYHLLRTADPAHPVLIVHFAADVVEKIAPYMDILGVDSYPVPNQPLSVFWNQLNRVRMAAGMQKPLWAVVQAFNKDVDGRLTRYPTPGELRNMVYQGITAGATGVLYFSYAWQGVLEDLDPALWAALGPVNRELETLAPVILEGGSPKGDVRVYSLGDVRTLVREWSGRTYVIVVNVGTSPTRVEVHRRAGGTGPVEMLFDTRRWQMTGGAFTDTLEAYGVRVYRF